MIVGMGIDAVEIERFAAWHQLTKKQLLRIFLLEEVNYCLALPIKSAERFAARFAAKEAFFKALCAAVPDHGLSFFTVCRHVAVVRDRGGAPTLHVDWCLLQIQAYGVHLSITHAKTVAIAVVIFDK